MQQQRIFSFEMNASKAILALILLIRVAKPYSAVFQDVSPQSYSIRLVPFLENTVYFVGEANITIFVGFSTTEITLNSKDLDIKSARVFRGDVEIASTFELKSKFDFLIVKTENYLAFNTNYNLRIKYESKLNDDLIGFYRSSFTVDKATKWLAATHFQSNFARMAFPCFDEPRHRATFNISLARYPHQTALSNMPLKDTSEPDSSINSRVWDTFQTTPPMPTYLLAFVVSEFHSISSDDSRIRIWARKNVIEDAQYIFAESQLILEHLENYLGIRYTLPKLDLVALPELKPNAMENWGLTLYRERALLCNAASSRKHVEFLTTTVAHEISHQWFGDYVSPESWDYTWLNEAFATYFKYFTTAAVEPSWKMDHSFVVDAVQSALFIDEVTCHHALTTKVKTTAEIELNFDLITHKKGAAVLRMFEHMLSPQTFRKALRRYLTDVHNSDSTAEPRDLGDAFDNQIIEDQIFLPQQPSEMLEMWTKNRGYPLITVTRKTNQSRIIFDQTTYKSPRSRKRIPDAKWTVPVTFTTKKSPNFESTQPIFWSGLNSINSVETDFGEEDWVLANKRQIGYFRVNYDLENWNVLIKQLLTNPKAIHVLNRAQLIDDAFTMAVDEKLPYQVAFNLANYLDQEQEMTPWLSALKHFANLYSNYQHTNIGSLLEEYFSNRISSYYKRIGFFPQPTDDHFTKSGRTTLLSIASQMGNPDCIIKSKKLYEKFSDDLSKIPGDLKYPVYCSLLSYGNSQSVWNKLWAIYLRTDSAFESEIILSVIGCMNDEKLIESILTKIISEIDDDIRKQNNAIVLYSVCQTSSGITAILNFMDNLLFKTSELSPKVEEKLKTVGEIMGTFIKTENQIKSLKTLINKLTTESQKSKNIIPTLRKAYEESLIRVQMNNKRIDELKSAVESSSTYFLTFKSVQTTPSNEKPSALGTRLTSSKVLLSVVTLFVYSKYFIPLF